jgi:hypothetical protein
MFSGTDGSAITGGIKVAETLHLIIFAYKYSGA